MCSKIRLCGFCIVASQDDTVFAENRFVAVTFPPIDADGQFVLRRRRTTAKARGGVFPNTVIANKLYPLTAFWGGGKHGKCLVHV